MLHHGATSLDLITCYNLHLHDTLNLLLQDPSLTFSSPCHIDRYFTSQFFGCLPFYEMIPHDEWCNDAMNTIRERTEDTVCDNAWCKEISCQYFWALVLSCWIWKWKCVYHKVHYEYILIPSHSLISSIRIRINIPINLARLQYYNVTPNPPASSVANTRSNPWLVAPKAFPQLGYRTALPTYSQCGCVNLIAAAFKKYWASYS